MLANLVKMILIRKRKHLKLCNRTELQCTPIMNCTIVYKLDRHCMLLEKMLPRF